MAERKHKVIDSDGNTIRTEEDVTPDDIQAARQQAKEQWEWVPGAATVSVDGKGGVMATMEWVPSNRRDVLLKNNKCPRCNKRWPHTGVCHLCEIKDRALQRLGRLHHAIDDVERRRQLQGDE